MSSSLLPYIEITTGPSPIASVIWLHGLGADGHDFEPVVSELNLPASLPVRFILPHAPSMPVTINNGYIMPAWYDINHPDLLLGEDEAGIRASQHKTEKLIQQEISRGIPAERILLAGFSQGGAIVLQTGLRYEKKLGGIIALSTYLPLKSSFSQEVTANRNIPIFMAHGSTDNVIPLHASTNSKKILEDTGCAVEWHEYAMAHSVCAEEIRDISLWLRRVLSTA